MNDKLRAAVEAVNAAQRAGKFPESRREHYLAAYLDDPEGAQATMDRLYAVPGGLRAMLNAADPASLVYDALYGPPPRTPGNPATDRLYTALYGGH